MSEALQPESSGEIIEDMAEAIGKLRNYSDDKAHPVVVDFAHFLSHRFSPSGEIEPQGFVNESLISAIELKEGKDDRGHVIDINQRLVKQEWGFYEHLLKATPDIARKVFSKKFADAVELELTEFPIRLAS